MPRHVVTVYPKRLVVPTRRNRSRRKSIVSRLALVYRATPHPDGDALEIHFPKRKSRREAKQEVVAALDEIDPEWKRLFGLYPTESALRDRGE